MKARSIKDSWISQAAPVVREVWDYLLREANHADKKYAGVMVKRGQLFRTYGQIRDDLAWRVGFRIQRYTEDQMKHTMKLLRTQLIITLTNTPRGCIITILNYDKFQDPKNYESTNESTDEYTNDTPRIHRSSLPINKNDKNRRMKDIKQNTMSSSGKPNVDRVDCFSDSPSPDESPLPDSETSFSDPPMQTEPQPKPGNKGIAKDIQAVFDYWKSVLDHPKARLDDKRRQRIKARLRDGYSVDDLRSACDGCRSSPYHQGENERGAVYDDIELICRDGKHVDQFIKLARDPTARTISAKGRQARKNGEIWLEMRQKRQQAQQEAGHEQGI